MVTLENINHNFPLLAQQSGFNFQLHRGRVNWSEIENLDINEITERRNFELLEQNLVNVTNFNLEREHDFKMMDQNFIKLFKLAQLGIDYLSYCEMYLDKCVVLLQEQLNASQDECELLKKKILRRKEVDKNQNKNKTLNYQCEKCAKVFISDVYLKFHEKRRHGNTNPPDNFDESPPKCSCDCQKREENRKLSTSTQTLFSDEVMTFFQEKEHESNTKMQYLLKVEKLERELENLKERFLKAENTIAAKAEAPKPDELHSINVPNSLYYNSILMLLPSYLTHLGNNYCEITSGSQITPEVSQSNINLPRARNSDPVNSNLQRESMSDIANEPKMSAEKKCEVVTEEKINSCISDNAKKFQKYQSEELECEKENLDPKIKAHNTNVATKPLPPPRKLNKGTRRQSDLDLREIVKRDADEEHKTTDLNNHFIVRSTPVKEKLEEETKLETFEESIENINEVTTPKANSFENLKAKKSVLIEPGSKSFIKKIVTRGSSSIQKLNKNFNTSLNNICDSASFTEKKSIKKETNFQNLRTVMINGLNNHLQRLGISSEWNGIPRKTMRQKMRAWKHQRKLLFKENSLYPLIRQNIEEKIFQNLKKNLRKKEETTTNKLNGQESENFTTPEIQESLFEKKSELVKSKNCIMYDTDTDSESRGSVSCDEEEQNYSFNTIIVKELSSSVERIDSKSDKLLLQSDKNSLNNGIKESNQKLMSSNGKLFMHSETESSFLENFHNKSFKENVPINYDEEENYEKLQFELSGQGEASKISRPESILKDAERFQTKPLTINQKKVLFKMYSKGVEEELSEDTTDDDLWSLKSDREKNAG